MQTNHYRSPAVGAPGMLYDAKEGNDVISCIADEDLQPGRFVELGVSDDKTGVIHVQLPQQTTSVFNTLIGVVVRDMQREANSFPDNTSQGIKAGTRCAVLRRGRIFVERDSADTAAVSRFSVPNVMHSSSTATKRGMVTMATASTAAGVEITAQTLSQAWQDDSSVADNQTPNNVMLLEVYVK